MKSKFHTKDNSRKGIFEVITDEYCPELIKRQVLSLKKYTEYEAGYKTNDNETACHRQKKRS